MFRIIETGDPVEKIVAWGKLNDARLADVEGNGRYLKFSLNERGREYRAALSKAEPSA